MIKIEELGLAIKGQEFVICAMDTNVFKDGMILTGSANKFYTISPHTLFAGIGDHGEIGSYITKMTGHAEYFQFSNFGRPISTNVCTHYGRHLAYNMFKAKPNTREFVGLLCGFDHSLGPMMSTLHHTGTMYPCEYACLGLARDAANILMDRHLKADLTVDQAYALIKKIVKYINENYELNVNEITVKVVDKFGTRDLENIDPKQGGTSVCAIL